MNDELNKLLENLIGKKIDVTVVHNIEGIHLVSTGILKEVTEDLLKIEVEEKEHWWSRPEKGIYVCNRKASSLLSIFIYEE